MKSMTIHQRINNVSLERTLSNYPSWLLKTLCSGEWADHDDEYFQEGGSRPFRGINDRSPNGGKINSKYPVYKF